MLICKVLKLFVNALTARDKYSLRNGDNLREPNQMQLSEKEENFSELFFELLESTLNFEHFPTKEDPHS